MSFNTRYKSLPYIIKLNFDETFNNTDYTKLMKLKFIMHVPMIVKDIFYVVTKCFHFVRINVILLRKRRSAEKTAPISEKINGPPLVA